MGLGKSLYRGLDRVAGGYLPGGHRPNHEAIYDKAGNLVDDISGVTAAKKAAAAQESAADRALNLQREMFEKSIELQEPWRQAGVKSLGDLVKGIDSGEFEMPEESFGRVNLNEDPGYQFRLDQGNRAIEHSAAARGGLFTPSTLKSLASFSQGLASQEYNNAYSRQYGEFSDRLNRKKANLNDRFNRLTTLAGLGQSATSQQGSDAGNFGSSGSNLITQRGNATAAGIVGGYNNKRDLVMGGLKLATLAI